MTAEVHWMESPELANPRESVKADLHNHFATLSSMPDFNKVVNHIERKLGRGAVVGLVNFSDRRYEDFIGQRGYERYDKGVGIYVPEKDITIIKGQEVPTKEGHLLVLGLKKFIHLTDGKRLEETIEEARGENGILIADHPFYRDGIGTILKDNPHYLEKCLETLDGIETHNGEAVYLIHGVTPKGANKRALLFYYQTLAQRLKAIITSDGHSVREIGSSWMGIPRLDVNNLANSLRESILHDNESDLRYREEHNSYLGLATHIGALGIDALARKLR